MSATGRAGQNGEMFLNDPRRESPIVEPLRINKQSASATSPAASVSSQRAQAPPTQSATSYPMPALPSLPSLPYPEDDPPQRLDTSPAPYPYPDPRRIGSPGQAGAPANARMVNGKRTGSASSTEIPAGLRTGDGRATQTLAERRGNVPNALAESATLGVPEQDAIYGRMPHTAPTRRVPSAENSQPYFPPPSAGGRRSSRDPSAMNRISSTASTSTTRASRGSPPPPETPVTGPAAAPEGRPLTDIEARYAASGIPGAGTLTSMQAQSLAAQARAAQYSNQQPARRPWTPTEEPGSAHVASAVYRGDSEVSGAQSNVDPFPIPQSNRTQARSRVPQNALETDMARLQVADEPPPAYSQVSGGATGQYAQEKQKRSTGGAAATTSTAPATTVPQQVTPQQHPAFANDPRLVQNGSPQPVQNGVQQEQTAVQRQPSQSHQAAPASPPPLPEGWIAHLDPNSGQYYYIHLPTQSTQWEFPKGPTPLNIAETPLSPIGAFHNPLASPGLSFGSKPLASPGIPTSPIYDGQSMFGMSSPGAFTGPPPSSGVDIYKVGATNGVYFGPYLRYANMDLERGIWYGSILLVTDAPQPQTIHIHQTLDLSPNPRQLKAQNIGNHQRWTFYKYEFDLKMDDAGPAQWTYAITSHLGCTRYEFTVAGRHETAWRIIAFSGNDFALNVGANERARLGGVGFLWKDIMQKHTECGGFHCQLGIGGQIYADRIWKEIPSLKQWLATSGKENRKNAVWTAAHEEDVTHAYFHYYTSHFDQPYLREAFAQIPYVVTIDDHDIFDGFGSYPEHMQFSNMFKNIGRIGIEMYLLFQHHTTLEILRNVSDDRDLFTVTGTGWHFVKYLGPALAVVGPDTRSERTPHQVMAGPTWQGLFPKIAMLPQSIQHCLLLIPVPMIYPRLDAAEQIASTVATGKKAVTGAYNMLGKVTAGVAGVVGAKGAVGSGFDSVKRAVGKSGLMGSILSPFGEIDVLDELKDAWTHESKDLERTYFIRTLQGIAHQRQIRFTFLSGSVNTCGAGLVHDPSHPSDHKTMYQLISSSVVNTPPNSYVLKLLNTTKPLYIPQNGQRSTPSMPTDTKEDMMEIFQHDVLGQPLPNGNVARKLMARRNYLAIVVYDPEVVQGTFGRTDTNRGTGRLSLAADFLVQSEGAYGASTMKYGPVVVPSLEYGR